jgi:hypothetical protein
VNASRIVVVTDDCPLKAFVHAFPGYQDRHAFVTETCFHDFCVDTFVDTPCVRGDTPHQSVQPHDRCDKDRAISVFCVRALGFGFKPTKLATQGGEAALGAFDFGRSHLFGGFVAHRGFQCGDVTARRIQADTRMLDREARLALVICGEVDVSGANFELFRRQSESQQKNIRLTTWSGNSVCSGFGLSP